MAESFLADFFLIFDEGEDLSLGEFDAFEPRRCHIVDGVSVEGFEGAVVIRVTPAYGLRGAALRQLVIAPQLHELPISKVSLTQAPVHILRVPEGISRERGIVHVDISSDRLAKGTITVSADEARTIANAAKPDFYLVLDDDDVAGPWDCYRSRTATTSKWTHHVLVTVDSLIPGRTFGLGERKIGKLMVARQTPDEPLLPITEWPVQVLVYRVLVDSPATREQVEPERRQLLGTGRLYDSENAARDAVRRRKL